MQEAKPIDLCLYLSREKNRTSAQVLISNPSFSPSTAGSDAEIMLHLGQLESIFQTDRDAIETLLPRPSRPGERRMLHPLVKQEMLEKGRRGCNYKRWNLAKIQHVIGSVSQNALQKPLNNQRQSRPDFTSLLAI